MGYFETRLHTFKDFEKPWALVSQQVWNIDLWNEVLNIDLGLGAAKISKVKVGVW